MVSLRRPSSETIRAFLASQSELDFTYAAVGATASVPPAGYAVDHTRIKLGEGEEVFTRAKAALGRWEQFRLGWVEAWPPGPRSGRRDRGGRGPRAWALVAECLPDRLRRGRGGSGHAGTGSPTGRCPDHAGTGEERFLVEWDRASGEVRYDILAFSRPHRLLIRLGYPYMRRVQKRFGRESAAAMVKAVKDDAG